MKVPYYTLSRQFTGTSYRSIRHRQLDISRQPFGLWLVRPYLDLGPLLDGPLHAQGLEHVYHQAADPTVETAPLQARPPAVLRRAIIIEMGLTDYLVDDPGKLPDALQTDRWRFLVMQMQRFKALNADTQARLITLLDRLSFYDSILALLPPIDDNALVDSGNARLAYLRALASYKVDPTSDTYLQELARIALHRTCDPRIRLAAALTLVVRYAKGPRRDTAQVQRWAKQAADEYRHLDPTRHWVDCIYASVYWRSVSFSPYLIGDQATTTAYLDRASSYGELVMCNIPARKITHAENLHALLETRTKEALWLGDRELALERMRQLVVHDPFDPKIHIHYGDLLLSCGHGEEACAAYREAAQLGAPYTAFAQFMVGHCLEILDDIPGACDAYLSTANTDSGAVTALERLVVVATRLGRTAIVRWTEARLAQLLRQVSMSQEARE
jgi:hypothetical protein